jgi:hypothetical protein
MEEIERMHVPEPRGSATVHAPSPLEPAQEEIQTGHEIGARRDEMGNGRWRGNGSHLEEVEVGGLGDERGVGREAVALQLVEERGHALPQRHRRSWQQHGLHHRRSRSCRRILDFFFGSVRSKRLSSSPSFHRQQQILVVVAIAIAASTLCHFRVSVLPPVVLNAGTIHLPLPFPGIFILSTFGAFFGNFFWSFETYGV